MGVGNRHDDSSERPRALADVPSTVLERAAFGTILLSQDAVVLDVNAEVCRMLGYARHELCGHEIHEFVHPDDHDLVARIDAGLRSGALESSQSRRHYLRRDGTVLYALAGLTAVRGKTGELTAIVKQIQDITPLVRAESELGEIHERQRVVVDSLHDGVLVQDARGRVRVSNPSAREILGVTRHQLHGWTGDGPVIRVIGEDGLPLDGQSTPARDTLRTGEPHTGVFLRIERPDGQRRWIRVNTQPLFRPGHERPYAVVSSIADVTNLKERERELAHHALHDGLTDLPNRRFFLEYLSHVLAERGREAGAVDAVLYVDLDGFKRINDRYGHGVGDTVLVEVAQRLAASVRPQDVVARLAGDEFAALLRRVGSIDEASDVAQRIVDAIGEPLVVDGLMCAVGTSVGVAVCQAGDSDPKAVLIRADASLRRAKESGKGRYVRFSEDVDVATRRRLQLERDLTHAEEYGELSVQLHPIVSLADGADIGVKASLCWRHTALGIVEPAVLWGLARESGLDGHLRVWCLRAALRALAADGGDGERVTVLTAAAQHLAPGSAERLLDLLEASGADVGKIVVAVQADDLRPDRGEATRGGSEELYEGLAVLSQAGLRLMLSSADGFAPSLREIERSPFSWAGVSFGSEGPERRDGNGGMLRAWLAALRENGVIAVAEAGGPHPDAPALRELGFGYVVRATGRALDGEAEHPSGSPFAVEELRGIGSRRT